MGMRKEESVGDLLETPRMETGITQEELGELFRAGGGKGTNGTVEAWLRGWREPRVSQYNLLASMLNEHLKKAKSKRRLPVLSVGPSERESSGATLR
jgi:hypothetical protein